MSKKVVPGLGSAVILEDGALRFGDGTNFLKVADPVGQITWGGTHKKLLAMRPAFTAGRTGGVNKPTMTAVGAYGTYSFPIYAADNEELFWRLYVPGRWDGTTDIQYSIIVALSDAETEGDDFRFQLSWANTSQTIGAMSATTVDVTADGDCAAGHTAQYSVFRLNFTIDVSAGPVTVLSAGDVMVGRLRRVASGGTEVSNEILLLDHVLNFTVDKVFQTA